MLGVSEVMSRGGDTDSDPAWQIKTAASGSRVTRVRPGKHLQVGPGRFIFWRGAVPKGRSKGVNQGRKSRPR
jgi:hypothetical protein